MSEKKSEKKSKKQSKGKGFPWLLYFSSIFLTLCVIALAANYVFSPKPVFQNLLDSSKYREVKNLEYTWGSTGTMAVGTVNWGVKETSGEDILVPTASTAKIITALVLLNQSDLDVNEHFAINANDVELYNLEIKRNGSNLPVRAGDVFTVKEALTAMMLVSANNMANTLATHYFGSLSGYKEAALTYLKDNDCPRTEIGSDASGLDPGTKSTATEMVKIGILAEKNEILSKIVAQQSSEIPGNATINNTNNLLSDDGFVGIKTGTTPSAGGCLVSAFEAKIGPEKVVIVVAILGDTTEKRFQDAKAVSKQFVDAIKYEKIIAKGEVIGRFDYANNKKEWMTADSDIFRLHFADEPIEITFNRTGSHTGEIVDTKENEQIGTASFPAHIDDERFCKKPKNNFERFKNAIWTPQCN